MSKVEQLPTDTPMKDFADDGDMGFPGKAILTSTGILDQEWWETQEQGGQIAFVNDSEQAGPRTSCRCQIIRSVSQWSVGTGLTEESIHNAYLSLIEKAEHYIYI
ncbi:hypothetical protein MLD38_010717 [Melastoma candidum]|uniref:Uncharacterized protein n=1 Tax=Melastoma candidum TaxID=119954 RepID=A0ACB9R0R8_9MYRT|nr:hypothetical protein MLD38_010717 [Melastoma candidum]